MGMHAKTAYNHQQRLLNAAKDCFAVAKHFCIPHAALLDRLDERVYKDAAWPRLSAERRGYLSGWIASMHERMYDVLEWRVFWRNQLVKSETVLPGTWNECDSDKGRHVYIKDPTKVY